MKYICMLYLKPYAHVSLVPCVEKIGEPGDEAMHMCPHQEGGLYYNIIGVGTHFLSSITAVASLNKIVYS